MKQILLSYLILLSFSAIGQAPIQKVKISDLPAMPGSNVDSGLVPITLGSTTYKATGWMFRQNDGLVKGTGIVTQVGTSTTFNTTLARYYINQVGYAAAAGSVTVDPAGDTGRIDAITVNTAGVLGVKKGPESLTNIFPNLLNTELALAYVFVTDTSITYGPIVPTVPTLFSLIGNTVTQVAGTKFKLTPGFNVDNLGSLTRLYSDNSLLIQSPLTLGTVGGNTGLNKSEIVGSGGDFNQTSGVNNIYNAVARVLQVSGNTQMNYYNANPIFSQASSGFTGNVVGYNYEPTVSTTFFGNEYAFKSKRGKLKFENIASTSDTSGKKLMIMNGAGDVFVAPPGIFGSSGGQNFANSDLYATGDRSHNFKQHSLIIDSLGYTFINSRYDGAGWAYIELDGADNQQVNIGYVDVAGTGLTSGLRASANHFVISAGSSQMDLNHDIFKFARNSLTDTAKAMFINPPISSATPDYIYVPDHDTLKKYSVAEFIKLLPKDTFHIDKNVMRLKGDTITVRDTSGIIDLSLGNFAITHPGVFKISNASSGTLSFPDPAKFDGQQIKLWNSDDSNDAAFDDSNTFAPVQLNGIDKRTSIIKTSLWVFISVAGQWTGGSLNN